LSIGQGELAPPLVSSSSFKWALFNLRNPKFGLGDLDLIVTWGLYNVLNKANTILF
jgi:hypothetical protein